MLYFARIPPPGTHQGLDIVDSFPIVDNSDALTYDGENWWIYDNGEIYCFDQNGDYIRSFPAPYQGRPVNALAWDGQYLWVEGAYDLYQRDIYGNPGPYGVIDFYDNAWPDSCTIKDDRIIVGDYITGGDMDIRLNVYDFNGNFLFEGFSKWIGMNQDGAFGSLAYHDGIVWVSYYQTMSGDPPFMEIYGLEYREGYFINTITTIENEAVWDMAICDADFINIAGASLGKIKAYFAEKEGGGE
ncbi:MAG: hypothetical protein GY771_14930 [bacterium]|nr:hypothetical protein [bacterium]